MPNIDPPETAQDFSNVLEYLRDYDMGITPILHTGLADASIEGNIHPTFRAPYEVAQAVLASQVSPTGAYPGWVIDYAAAHDLTQFALLSEAVKKAALEARKRTVEELNLAAAAATAAMSDFGNATRITLDALNLDEPLILNQEPAIPDMDGWEPDEDDETVPEPDVAEF